MAEVLEPAKRRRDTGIKTIQSAVAKVAAPNALDNFDYDQLRQRLLRVQEVMNNLRKDQSIVVENTEAQADRDALAEQFDDLEEGYMDTVAKVEQRLRAIAPALPAAQQPQQNAANVDGTQNNRPIVEVTMPETTVNTWGKFNGDKMQWFEWKSKFMLGVHEAIKVTKPNKLRFLGDALIGQAADVIRKL